MSKRFFISFVLGLVLALPLLIQVQKVQAESVAEVMVTAPISIFNLTGKVTYKDLGVFVKWSDRIKPAANVIIEVSNFFNPSQKMTTQTNSNGEYNLMVPDGLWQIRPSDNDQTFFSPPFKVMRIMNQSSKSADFQGLKFPH